MPKAPPPIRLDSIDLLRGFACLWVTYCHAHSIWAHLAAGKGALKPITSFIGIGGKGVDLFVVLSGFCLFFPMVRRDLDGLPQHSVGKFYARRLNRICPVYFSAVIFTLALVGLGFEMTGGLRIQGTWPTLLFVQNMMPITSAG